jgi:phosphotransferase system enzyme I (PtsP)
MLDRQVCMTDDSSLLFTLEEISQLVSHSHNPAETLTNIVTLIRDRVQSAVCSVYLLELERSELVLGATVGLKSEAIGRVRMHLNEGLTGLVAELMRPVMVPDAFEHPRFKYFPEAGEDRYHSFLGVPLVESGVLQGVLVVQTMEPRMFRPSEIRMLVTVAAQLASLVADAHLLEKITAATHEAGEPQAQEPPVAVTLHGLALSPGTGYGRAYVVGDLNQWRQGVALESDDAEEQRGRLQQATDRAREELTRLSQRVSLLVGEEHAAILQAQLLIMQDESLAGDLQIHLEQGASAEGALLATLDKYVAAFQKLTTPFFQERIFDLKDVFYRILWHLRPRRESGTGEPSPSGGGEDRVVLVSREASVMELFAVDLDRLAGVVVEHGGPQSHAAILARSLGVPMVGQRTEFAELTRPGRLLLVDGIRGEVVLDPPAHRLPAEPPPRLVEQALPVASPLPGLPRIEVNINLLAEVEQARKLGVPGVGLYRSEFLFLARRTLPTEEEQVSLYRKLLGRLAGRPVTIRTFDLRPDKLASYSHLGSAASRPLDWRLVLESPQLQQLFLEQLRAILRAAQLGPVRILVPLVTRSEVLDFVVETLAKARCGLVREGLEFAPDVPLGVMIEVAAAIPLVGAWADQVAFFALGTNDLSASALGVGRDDPLAASQLDPLHPGLLRLIDDVVSIAHPMGRPVTVCGEMTADPVGAVALAALQIDSLSVPVHQYLAARESLARLSADNLIRLKPLLLRQRTAAEIRGLLAEWLHKKDESQLKAGAS